MQAQRGVTEITLSNYRPTLLAHIGDEFTTGSCRSIPEFHIAEALDQCDDLLTRYGGHAAAAGFTLANENWQAFKDRLTNIAEHEIGGQDLRPTITADIEIPIEEASWALLDALHQLQPTGQANPEPVFVSRNLQVVNSRTVGRDNSHLKLTVRGDGMVYDAIAFRMGDLQQELSPTVDLAYNLESNEFRGETTLQLNVRDIRTTRA
ncbi:MAG: DHHA1 domain-containing protein [Anaerolineales bacterium]|nr:DHHA1 domain-containing protein [Anaerolineales bacterium]